MAAGGYPDHYRKGDVIEGLEKAGALQDVTVFHAGTRLENGKVVTSGGRVLGITALATDLPSAATCAYDAVKLITFKDAHYRRDIAASLSIAGKPMI
jgi:phosphoribosylamine--glycine ligase